MRSASPSKASRYSGPPSIGNGWIREDNAKGGSCLRTLSTIGRVYFTPCGRCLYGNSMSLPSVTFALLSALLIVGCATSEPQSSSPQTGTFHRDDIATPGGKKKHGQ